MAKYVAYNKLYYNGIPSGRKFVVGRGDSAQELREKAMKDNDRWSKYSGKHFEGKPKAVLVEIKRVGQIKRKIRTNNMSWFDI